MGKRKSEQHRGHHGRKRRRLAAERENEAAEEAKHKNEQQNVDLNIIHDDFIPLDEDTGAAGPPETREYFGMLTEDEQEEFKRLDNALEDDDPNVDRDELLATIFEVAKGKELKLACSQSCSRLMERLILLSNTRQKKGLFDAFANHFPTLVTHRFGSHCCEQLFLQSAPVITRELTGEVEGDDKDAQGESAGGDAEKQPLLTMEELFLLVLDELEENLAVLMTDTFGSHTLRVLLTVLSGRPLSQVATKSLLQSKRKEQIALPDGLTATEEIGDQPRAVPACFDMAVRKIISDVLVALDPTMLAVMVKHPTGNPILQLLLELDIALNTKANSKRKSKAQQAEEAKLEAAEEKPKEDAGGPQTLLERLLPGAPSTLGDETSEAARFVSGAIYDSIGSRLLETLVSHCPGKIFKGLWSHIIGPRFETLLRNETATYVAMKALVRLSREDLAEAVQKTIPKVEMLVSKGRFNILTLLFERCHAREASASTDALLKAVTEACSGLGGSLVRTLCYLDDDEASKEEKKDKVKKVEKDQSDKKDKKDKKDKDKKDKKERKDRKDKPAVSQEMEPLADPPKKKDDLVRNGTKLATTMIQVGGKPAQAVQGSLLFLDQEKLLHLATSSTATAKFLTAALSAPSSNPIYHKMLVTALKPHAMELAHSFTGSFVINAIALIPSKAEGFALPFFIKQSIVEMLTVDDASLRSTPQGRKVWAAWKGELWVRKRAEWTRWAKEVEPEEARWAKTPQPRVKEERPGQTGDKKEGRGQKGRHFTDKDDKEKDKKRKKQKVDE
ncbi:hypothetical protein PpBr36_04333 [Pyricularia pennisetigena]|uniref:hypothetical protein n=1 Tax=Pyricularia pennisetigena TaxID=1578925 RepID=UPI001150441A|nr:hypothetical protein PpBr36_04333 [Pyricularia pennisetigena]TLS27297.1 hypothetical protein PpBr36_04333 [Pyricularia pennisetigena]